MEGDLLTRKDIDELKELLRKQLSLAEDSNKILHASRKWGRVAFAAKVVIWTVVLVVPVLLYPYITKILPIATGPLSATSTTASSLFGYPSPAEIQTLIHPEDKN